MKRILCIATAMLALAACDDEPAMKDVAKPPASVASAAAKPASATATSASDVPTEEDFEAQVEKDITPTNLDAQVSKLEKELAP